MKILSFFEMEKFRYHSVTKTELPPREKWPFSLKETMKENIKGLIRI